MLHVGRDKIYYLLRTEQLRSIKIGELRRITGQQLAEFHRVPRKIRMDQAADPAALGMPWDGLSYCWR